jgi:hypothetical protein
MSSYVVCGDINPREGLPISATLARLSEPACFWLDAHFSGEGTARGAADTAICGELEAILKHPVRGHVILVDDARYFRGKSGYPSLDELLAWVRQIGA